MEQGQGDIARDAVFVPTGELPMDDPVTVAGYDFNEGTDYDKLFECNAISFNGHYQQLCTDWEQTHRWIGSKAISELGTKAIGGLGANP